MKTLDLVRALKQYKSGWVAIDEESSKVITHAKNFAQVTEKVKGQKNIFIMPATGEYFGFVHKA